MCKHATGHHVMMCTIGADAMEVVEHSTVGLRLMHVDLLTHESHARILVRIQDIKAPN